MVAMLCDACWDASAAFEEFERTGWMGLPSAGCPLGLDSFLGPELMSMVAFQEGNIGGRGQRRERAGCSNRKGGDGREGGGGRVHI